MLRSLQRAWTSVKLLWAPRVREPFIHSSNICSAWPRVIGRWCRSRPGEGWGARALEQVRRIKLWDNFSSSWAFRRPVWGQMPHLRVVRARPWPRGLGLLLAPQGAVTTCSEGNRYRASSLHRPRVRGKLRRQLRLHAAPPLPLFCSDAAVEAAAATPSPRPEAHPPARRARLPLPLERHQSAPEAPRAGWSERWKKTRGVSLRAERKGRGWGRERLLGDLRHCCAPFSSRPSLWSEARAPHWARETASWAPGATAAAAAASVRAREHLRDPAPVHRPPPGPLPWPGPAGAAATSLLPPSPSRPAAAAAHAGARAGAGGWGAGRWLPWAGTSRLLRGERTLRRGRSFCWSRGAGRGTPKVEGGGPSRSDTCGSRERGRRRAEPAGSPTSPPPRPPARGRSISPRSAWAGAPRRADAPRLGGRGPRCEAAAGAAGTAGPAPPSFPSLPRPSAPSGGLRSRPVAGPPAPRQDSGRSS